MFSSENPYNVSHEFSQSLGLDQNTPHNYRLTNRCQCYLATIVEVVYHQMFSVHMISMRHVSALLTRGEWTADRTVGGLGSAVPRCSTKICK